jgi:hypothetical protein
MIGYANKNRAARNGESGNVLFLILIAVALFAALSYAVTQSSRSGGGDAGKETNLLNSAQITQYPAAIRTSVLRMVIGGTDVGTLQFNAPSDFSLSGFVPTKGVFHPTGGGATYTLPPADMITGTNDWDGKWHFNSQFSVPQLGIDGTGGADLIAFLPGVTDSICSRINIQLGVGGATGTPPVLTADEHTEYMKNIQVDASSIDGVTQSAFVTTAVVTLPTALTGQPFGCFANPTTVENVYYHVLVER